MSESDPELVSLMAMPLREVIEPRSTAIRAGDSHGASVSLDQTLGDALLRMVRDRRHTLAVRDAGRVVATFDSLDLLGRIVTHSHLAALQVDRASLDELRTAARQIEPLVASLHASGLRVDAIARHVSDCNGRLYARLWSQVAPPELVEASCLIVMGSEGRGEQTLRTDQDNALLLRDGVDPALAEAAALRFNAALIDFGWPPCDGNVMLTNPLWRQSLAAFRETIRGWLQGGDAQGVMQLAIFVDAKAVAGDAGLLADARVWLDRLLVDNDAWFARFAAAVDLFPEPAGWWSRLATLAGREEAPLDLKKHGTFPIVHGVRALALEHRIAATPTAERLRQLTLQQQLPAELGRDLREVLQFLSELKLQNHLRQRQSAERPSHLVRPSELSLLARTGLRDSLGVVHQLRQFLHQHYRLDAL